MSTCAPTPDTATKISRKNACSCPVGSVIPRWKNVTAVRTQSDCADPATKATAVANGSTIPAARKDSTYYASTDCAGTTCGQCGGWLVGGDLNGLSAQEVTAGTDDIVAGATPDATHYTVDHNSYQAYPNAAASFFQVGDIVKIVTLGSTDWHAMGASATPKVGDIFTLTATGGGGGTAQLMRDMVMARRRGFNAIVAQKLWHGRPGFLDKDSACGADPSNPAAAVKYLKMEVTSIMDSTLVWARELVRNSDGVRIGGADSSEAGTGYWETNSLQQIDRLSGLNTASCTVPSVFQPLLSNDNFFFAPVVIGVYASLTDWRAGCNSFHPSGSPLTTTALTALFTAANVTASSGEYQRPALYTVDICTMTNTLLELKVTLNPNPYVYNDGTNTETVTGSGRIIFHFKVELSEPYYSTIAAALAAGGGNSLEADRNTASNAWNMSDFNLASLRLDENLAHGALCTWDEVQQPVAPVDNFHSQWMPDYTLASGAASVAGGFLIGTTYLITSVGTTDFTLIGAGSNTVGIYFTATGAGSGTGTADPQTAWLDPNSYYWVSTAGVGQPMNTAGGNVKMSPMYSGTVISHTISGSDLHFWFGALNYDPSSTPPFLIKSHGAYPDSQLPACTMRWMAPFDEQYDSALAFPPIGNFPQAFTDFSNGRLKGAKYCQAVQKWNAVKFCRPCGADKFAVDQKSVCCITDATAFNAVTGGTLQVAATTGATAPSSGYVIVEGDGVYPVTSLIGSALLVGARLDTLPTGYTFRDPDEHDDGVVHVGKVRWIGYTQYGGTFASAPGIDLKAAVTTSYAAGVLTVNSAGGLPYFRKGTDAALRAVNLYDASWTLLVSGLVLARTDDNHFTATTTNYPTAVWMMDAQFATAISAGATTDWTKYDGTSKQTGVHIGYGFDQRAAALSTGAQPKWLGGVTAGDGLGVVGCLDSGYSIAQFNYPGGSCPAIVGIVPTGSPEAFTPGLLFASPAATVDGVYGAHTQAFIGLTMEDPFDQTPFKPSCNGAETFSWLEDDGSGKADNIGGSPSVAYYALRPMVEALSAVPSGCSLPVDVALFFDPANKFPPPNYPNGIPLGHGVTSDWATAQRMCDNIGAAGRFHADYAKFVTCP